MKYYLEIIISGETIYMDDWSNASHNFENARNRAYRALSKATKIGKEVVTKIYASDKIYDNSPEIIVATITENPYIK